MPILYCFRWIKPTLSIGILINALWNEFSSAAKSRIVSTLSIEFLFTAYC